MAAAAAVLAVTGWAAAPALSLRPYVPAAVDFELRDSPHAAAGAAAAGTAGRLRQGGVALLSGHVRSGKRFNLVGLRWHGARVATLRLRVRRGGAHWGPWVAVGVDPDDAPDTGSPEARSHWTVSNPVWAGEADAVEYRLRAHRPVRDLRLHFVNTKGTATPIDRLRSHVRGLVAAGLRMPGALLGARDATAAGGAPPMVSRQQWGADQCPPRAAPSYGAVDVAFVHHTVTANEYGPQDSAAMVLAICRYHRNSNGWNDIGYNFLVDRYGTIFEGRAGGADQAVIGAQAQGYNSHSTGVANLGTFSTAGQTDAGLGAMARLLSWKLAIHGVPPVGTVAVRSGGGSLNRYPGGALVALPRITGHRDGDSTSCPGDGLYAQLPALRALVAAMPAPPVTKVSFAAAHTHVRYPDKAQLSGRLLAPDGSPLAARNVAIQFRSSSSGWLRLQGALTDPSGGFQTRVRLSYNRAVRAYFPGDPGGSAAAASSAVAIGVRPRVTTTLRPAAAGTFVRGQRAVVRGKVTPRKRSLLLLVDRRTRTGFRRITRRSLGARSGRVSAGQPLAHSGVYRLRFAALADTKNLGSRSDPVEITVAAAGG